VKARSDDVLKRIRAKTKAVKDNLARSDAAADAVLADLFTEQRAFITDPYKRKSLLCPRRAGKTHVVLSYALWAALKHPGSTIPIITVTLKNAKQLYWKPLAQFSEKYGLQLEFKTAEYRVLLPNGSQIVLGGAMTLNDIEKFRGGSYVLALIDECKSIPNALLEELILEVLESATNDASGTIAVVGTPGEVPSGFFYEATYPGLTDDENGWLHAIDFYAPEPFWEAPPRFDGLTIAPKWTRHYWTTRENVFCPEIWQNALAKKARLRWKDDNPIWVREELGRWVSTGDSMVYALNSIVENDGGVDKARCYWRKLTQNANSHGLSLNELGIDDWRYILGMDLGFEDDTAFVVVAHSPSNGVLYHVHEEKYKHLSVAHVANVIKRIVVEFDNKVDYMIADMGAQGKQIVESVNTMYGYNIEPAQKTAKFDHIELLNSDLWEERFKVLVGSDLADEWSKLQWDFRGLDRRTAIRIGRLREDYRFDNHLSDACLYTWRFAYHHFAKPVTVPPHAGSNEFYEAEEAAEIAELVAEEASKKVSRFANVGEIKPAWTQKYLDNPNEPFAPFDPDPFRRLL
jgi:hypothetical protein